MGKILLVLFAVYIVFALVFPKNVKVLARAYLISSAVVTIILIITGYWW